MATNIHPPYLLIGEIAARYGCSPRTLRFYEEKGLLAPVRVGSQRFYSASDEIKLQLVLRGKRLGFSLREIQDLILARSDNAGLNSTEVRNVASLLSKPEIAERITLLSKHLVRVEAAIEELRDALIASRPVKSVAPT